MIRAHKIKLEPNNIQATYFKKACGVTRFVYNWALSEWNRQYASGVKPSANKLKKEFNSIKRDKYPFVMEVTKCAAECAFSNLGEAFSSFFKGTTKYPRYHKKGKKDSFYVSNDKLSFDGKYVVIPRLGKVRISESLRFSGKIISGVVSLRAGRWFISIAVDTPVTSKNQAGKAVGVDLGIKHLAVLSDGTVFENSKSTKKFASSVRKLDKSLSRKRKGSSNWKKAKTRLANAHYKLSCARLDSIHKMTSWIANNYTDVCIEDLNVRGMVKNKRLAKAVSDASFWEIRRQLEYKVHNVHVVGRFFPSSKLCSNCGKIHIIPIEKRLMKCDCGLEMDRDLNAAKNLLREVFPIKPVESLALTIPCWLGETGTLKQELH